ncbi:MAG: hypothetical protein JWN03_3089 [Nocardia sp.]|nr:hypothetical protein [Nocardia sp.]
MAPDGGNPVVQSNVTLFEYDSSLRQHHVHPEITTGPGLHGEFNGNALVVSGLVRDTYRPNPDGTITLTVEEPRGSTFSPLMVCTMTRDRPL